MSTPTLLPNKARCLKAVFRPATDTPGVAPLGGCRSPAQSQGPSRAHNLTPKQEAFINAYLETGNASEAYRRAYDAAGMLPATIRRKAAELLENGKITARLAVLSDKAEVKALLSLEDHMEELKSCVTKPRTRTSSAPPSLLK